MERTPQILPALNPQSPPTGQTYSENVRVYPDQENNSVYQVIKKEGTSLQILADDERQDRAQICVTEEGDQKGLTGWAARKSIVYDTTLLALAGANQDAREYEAEGQAFVD